MKSNYLTCIVCYKRKLTFEYENKLVCSCVILLRQYPRFGGVLAPLTCLTLPYCVCVGSKLGAYNSMDVVCCCVAYLYFFSFIILYINFAIVNSPLSNLEFTKKLKSNSFRSRQE